MRPLTRSCFLQLLLGRLFLHALPFHLGTCLPSPWSPSFPPHTPVSSKFFDSQVSSISTEELQLPRDAHCVLSRLRCNGHSLLLSYLFRIGEIENPSCSACGHLSSHSALSSYGLFAPLTLWRLSVSLRPLVQALGNFRDSVTPWSSATSPSLGRAWVINNNKKWFVRGECQG